MIELTGKDVGRYHIIEPLGKGGMAIVYKAFDRKLEREVAIKFIRTERIPPDELTKMLARFEREGKALARMEHASIIRVFDYGEYEDTPYLVMNYLPGGTLKQYTGRSMHYREALKLLLPVARALEYAHEQGVVHRDVKPANILITRRGEPMLSDFGIARILENDSGGTLTGTGTGIGTPEYMAPEQWNGAATPAVDIYALGVVLYELVTGRTPYQADTPVAILMKVMNDPMTRPVDLIPGLPPEVEYLLFKAMAKDPEQRYASMSEMIAGMEKLLQGGEGPAPAIQPEQDMYPAETVVSSPEMATVPAVTRKSTPRSQPEGSNPSPDKTPAVKVGAGEKSKVSPLIVGGIGLGVIVVILLLLFVAGLSGAGPLAGLFATPEPTQVAVVEALPTPTVTPQPSRTAAPTEEPAITNTAAPAATNTPEPVPTPEPAATPAPGAVRVWEKDGMEQAYVPAGEFEMGSEDGEKDEQPVHKVNLDAFWMDKTEVTNAMFARFVSETGHQTDAEKLGSGWILTGGKWVSTKKVDWQHPAGGGSDILGMDQNPVALVSWNDATAYCAWAGKRLPTEAEWEKAARGTDNRKYPWGDQAAACELSNYTPGCGGEPSPAGVHPEDLSPYGVYDMGGNVAEWVSDWYVENYYIQSAKENPQGPASGKNRVLRGGSWSLTAADARVSRRTNYTPDTAGTGHGFRCVTPVEKP